MSTCNQLDLETLGSCSIVPNTLPWHLSKSIHMVDATSLAICKFMGKNTRVTIEGNKILAFHLPKPKLKIIIRICFSVEMFKMQKLLWILFSHLRTCPHLLVRATSKQLLPAWLTFSSNLTSESHLIYTVLVETIHWWPAPVGVSGLWVAISSIRNGERVTFCIGLHLHTGRRPTFRPRTTGIALTEARTLHVEAPPCESFLSWRVR